jgi:hypothetical protein
MQLDANPILTTHIVRAELHNFDAGLDSADPEDEILKYLCREVL